MLYVNTTLWKLVKLRYEVLFIATRVQSISNIQNKSHNVYKIIILR